MSDINIGKNSSVASASAFYSSPNPSQVDLRLTVNDEELRKRTELPHDGFERPFALVPARDGSWKRVELNYNGDIWHRGFVRSDNEYLQHVDLAAHNTDPTQIASKGIAFGMDVKGQGGHPKNTVWLQGFDENYRPI